MSKNKNYFEFIESYLDDDMSQTEKFEFENALQKDPLLKNEFEFQQDIIQSIKDYRVAELKSRLDAIEVGTGGTFSFLKIGSAVVVAALIGWGIYYFNNNAPIEENTTIAKNTENTEQETSTDKPVEHTPTEEVTETSEASINEVETAKDDQKPESTAENDQVEDATENSPIEEDKNKEEEVVITLPEVVEEFDDYENKQTADGITIPESHLEKVTDTFLPKTEVEELDDNRYAFHYQFYNNKLYLYGEFENKYEILELNTPSGISLYMFYKDNFYHIKQSQEKVTPLVELKDKNLIESLRIIRQK
ncbi:hypothetical protein QQ008_01425 [Fulvivirgaceae bacterium BMA10]|uniref:Anti-sigma factor n=1 Tax=Splendidivirga corallicola TaxID=3051826 RepID=A0ABT8KGZ7_9BACT|nr:hypothetical protein [Fulvivirgaceae bacterium BMA10]